MRSWLLLVSLLVASPLSTGADSYPAKPVRVIASFGPGSTVDLIARVVSQQLSDQLGKSFVVDNRTGAGGSIGNGLAAKSPSDGYTLLFGETGLTMLPGLFRSLPYDAVRDFTPVSQVVRTPMALVVHPSVKASSLKEFVALAQASPGKLNYASAGVGSPVNLASELFKIMSRVDIAHVAYKGGGEMVTSVLGGQVQMLLTTMPTVLSQINAGKVRALAVTTEGKRVSVLPDVPSMSEAGVSGMTIYTWSGLFGPAGMPKDIVARLHAEVVKAIAAPAVRERFNVEGAEPVGSSPQEFAAHVRNELKRWADVIKSAGIKAE
jgi:tripartite-type tricarboxylate transporter receptor subunit TctC